MSDNEKTQDSPVYKIGDDLIAVIRELVQLSLLTGTNIVDHLRAILVEVDEDTGKLIPTQEYTDAYNVMIEDLSAKARQQQEEAERALQDQIKSEGKISFSVETINDSEENDLN